MKRPLWTIGLAYAAALLPAPFVGLNASFLLGVLCLAAFFCALLFPVLRKRRGLLAALFAAAAAFCVFFGVEALRFRPLSPLEDTEQVAEGRVTAVEDGRCVVSTGSGGAIPEGMQILVYYGDETPPPDAYDYIRASVKVLASAEQLTLSQKAAGMHLTAVCTGYGEAAMETVPPDSRPLAALIGDAGAAFRTAIRRVLPGEEGALVSAVCLGMKQDVSAQTTQDFRRAGLSHLLAVSGLHMSVIAQAVLALLLFLKIPRRCAAGMASAAVLFFMLLTGLSASAVRAGVMCLAVLLAQIVNRDADSLSSMGAALLLLTLSNPFAVWDVGLQLSFAATLGLVVLVPWLRRQADGVWRRARARRTGEEPEPEERMPAPLRVPLDALCVTFGAMLPTLPVIAFVFGSLSMAAPLSNLLGIYASTVLLVTGCLAMVLGTIPALQWASQGLLLLSGGAAKYLLGLTHTLGGWGPATISMSRPWLLAWLTGALLLLWLGWRLLRKKGLARAGALAVLAFVCGLGMQTLLTRGVTTVTSVELGDNLALLLERDGKAGLVAAGDKPDILEAADYALRSRGITRLNFLLLPSWDKGAAAGLPELTDSLPVDCLLYPDTEQTGETAQMTAAEAREALSGRDTFTFWNDGLLECREDGWLRLSVGDTRLLLCPPGGTAAALPPDWRNTHLAVFTGTPPLFSSALNAQGAVLGCYTDNLPLVTKALPWGAYPIRLTAVEGDVTVQTRGLGDLEMK